MIINIMPLQAYIISFSLQYQYATFVIWSYWYNNDGKIFSHLGKYIPQVGKCVSHFGKILSQIGKIFSQIFPKSDGFPVWENFPKWEIMGNIFSFQEKNSHFFPKISQYFSQIFLNGKFFPIFISRLGKIFPL